MGNNLFIKEDLRKALGYSSECHIYEVSFYRKEKDGIVYWYANIPNHTEEENEMVMGADSFIETLCENNKENPYICNNCSICFTTRHPINESKEEKNDFMFHFHLISHDDEGAYYKNSEDNSEIWLCNVMHDVCGCHPEDIYILSYTYNHIDKI